MITIEECQVGYYTQCFIQSSIMYEFEDVLNTFLITVKKIRIRTVLKKQLVKYENIILLYKETS